MNSILDHALRYAGKKLAVFPVKPRSKIPGTKNGVLDATADPDTVKKMFARKKSCNIGVATGTASQRWILDVDGLPGIEALRRLEKKHSELQRFGREAVVFSCTFGSTVSRSRIVPRSTASRSTVAGKEDMEFYRRQNIRTAISINGKSRPIRSQLPPGSLILYSIEIRQICHWHSP